MFNAPVHLVFEAWTKPELFRQWWLPRSLGMTLHGLEMDARTGGTYHLNFGEGADFYGTYLEVTPHSRIVWTNDEGGENSSVTTVSFAGPERQDAGRDERGLPLTGSARGRCRRGAGDARDVRPARPPPGTRAGLRNRESVSPKWRYRRLRDPVWSRPEDRPCPAARTSASAVAAASPSRESDAGGAPHRCCVLSAGDFGGSTSGPLGLHEIVVGMSGSARGTCPRSLAA